MAWDWIDVRCVKCTKVLLLCLLSAACSAKTEVRQINNTATKGTIEYVAIDVAQTLDKMARSIPPDKKINVAFEAGFDGKKRLPCDSDLSKQLKSNLKYAFTNLSHNFALPAFDYADVIAFYEDEYSFNSENWRVDYVVFAEFKSDVVSDISKVNINILNVANKRIRKSLLYSLNNVSYDDVMKYTHCSCERFCSQPQPIRFTSNASVNEGQTRQCRLIAKQDKFTRSNCSIKVMKQPVTTNNQGLLSANEVEQKCNACGAELPSVESLEELALCSMEQQGVNRIACVDKGKIVMCTTGLRSIKTQILNSGRKVFDSIQCEFNQ